MHCSVRVCVCVCVCVRPFLPIHHVITNSLACVSCRLPFSLKQNLPSAPSKESTGSKTVVLALPKCLRNERFSKLGHVRTNHHLSALPLQDLPIPTPVEMCIPAEHFGDAVTVVEFLNNFSFLFDVEEELGGTITLGELHSVVSEDVDLQHETLTCDIFGSIQ